MPATAVGYMRTQGAIAAVVNAVVNPALAWAVNRGMEFVPLAGIATDAAVTTVALSLLVALCVAPGARRDLENGRVSGLEGAPREGRVLPRLPRRAWALGLSIGLGGALVLVPVLYALFRLFGVAGLSFARFAAFKAAYTAALGFAVTRVVVRRQLTMVPSP